MDRELSDIDKKMLAIFQQANGQLIADFFDAVKKKNVDRQNFLLSKIIGIQNHLKTNFDVRTQYTVPYQYLQGVSQIAGPDKEAVDKLLAGISGDVRADAKILQEGVGSILGTVHGDAVKNLITNNSYLMNNAIDALGRTAQRRMSEVIRTEIGELLAKSTAIGKSWSEQKQELMKAIMDKGIASFRDRGGRSWDIARYADTIVRTESARAYNQGTINKGTEVGITKYKVIEQPDACPICQPHNGKIYDITDNPQLPPYHPSCRGIVVPIIE